MNNTLRAIVALGAAGLSLLALAGSSSAQTTTGDPNLTTVFSTLNNGKNPSFTIGSQSVGFDPNGGGGALNNSTTASTAQSVYEAFNFTSSAAGAFTSLASGTTAQIQVFASNNNVNTNASGIAPFNIYAALYAFNPNSAAGTVPITGANLFGSMQKITLAGAGGYFSGDFNLTGPITAGNQYVLGLTTLTGDTQDFASIADASFANSGLATGDQSFDKNKFITDTNDQGNPAGQPATTLTTGNNVLAFRIAAAAPPAVPEASSFVSMGLMLGLGAAFVAFKRRRSVAK